MRTAWQSGKHIKVLEARAFVLAVRWRMRGVTAIGCRFLHLISSRVTMEIAIKGRSSSRRRRKVLSKCSFGCCNGAGRELAGCRVSCAATWGKTIPSWHRQRDLCTRTVPLLALWGVHCHFKASTSLMQPLPAVQSELNPADDQRFVLELSKKGAGSVKERQQLGALSYQQRPERTLSEDCPRAEECQLEGSR